MTNVEIQTDRDFGANVRETASEAFGASSGQGSFRHVLSRSESGICDIKSQIGIAWNYVISRLAVTYDIRTLWNMDC
jgi:hypothetical protein